MSHADFAKSKYRAVFLALDQLIYSIVTITDGDKTSIANCFSIDADTLNSDKDIYHTFQFKYAQRHLILPPKQYTILPRHSQNIKNKKLLNDTIAKEQRKSPDQTCTDFIPIAESTDRLFAIQANTVDINSLTQQYANFTNSINTISVLDIAVNGIAAIHYLDSKPIASIFLGEHLSRAYVHNNCGILSIIPLPSIRKDNAEHAIKSITTQLQARLHSQNTTPKHSLIFLDHTIKAFIDLKTLEKNIEIKIEDISHHPKLLFKSSGNVNTVEALLALACLDLANPKSPNPPLNLMPHTTVNKDWRYYLNQLTLERLSMVLFVSLVSSGFAIAHEYNSMKKSKSHIDRAQTELTKLNAQVDTYQQEQHIIAILPQNTERTKIMPHYLIDNINQSYKSFNEQSDIPTIWANAIVIDVKQGNITIEGETNQSSTPDLLRYKLNDAIRTQNTNSPNLQINTLIPIVLPSQAKNANDLNQNLGNQHYKLTSES